HTLRQTRNRIVARLVQLSRRKSALTTSTPPERGRRRSTCPRSPSRPGRVRGEVAPGLEVMQVRLAYAPAPAWLPGGRVRPSECRHIRGVDLVAVDRVIADLQLLVSETKGDDHPAQL